MNIKVSIIVPVYNTENYLVRCLDSLVNQSLKEIEIILINDCSQDHSLDILQRYKQKYAEKIVIINLNENKGPGGARNEGINVAKGEYLGFVDSDDDVCCTMFEELYNIALVENYDLVDCEFYYEAFNQNMKTTSHTALGELNLDKKRELFIHSGFIWSKIIKRNILIDKNIRFREKSAFEDIDFLRKVIFYCKKISASDKVLYNYRDNDNSISSRLTEDIQIYQKMEALISLVKNFKDINAYDDFKDEITYLVYKSYMIMLEYAVSLENENMNLALFKELQDFFFELVNYDYQDNKYISQFSREERLFAEVNNADYKQLISICAETLDE